jgi:hypothetical protein
LVGWSGSVTQDGTTAFETRSTQWTFNGSANATSHQSDNGDESWFWQQTASWHETYQYHSSFFGSCALEPPHTITHDESGQGSGTVVINLGLEKPPSSGPTFSGTQGPDIPPGYNVHVVDTCTGESDRTREVEGFALSAQPASLGPPPSSSGASFIDDGGSSISTHWQMSGASGDSDYDGVPDSSDNCDYTYNTDQADANGNGVGDACDGIDTDGDGITDSNDQCPSVRGVAPTGCPPDRDSDGVPDTDDNCPLDANADQKDSDGDGRGDACDSGDRDEDSIPDEDDNCPDVANADQADSDGDGIGDACDHHDDCSFELPAREGDADGDRLPDAYETGIVGSDPNDPDSDDDCVIDTVEVASGSSPLNPDETPDSLPAGIAATALSGNGDVGVTCGRTKFRWVTPARESLGVSKGAESCILLLSNRATNAVIDFALEHDRESITSALTAFTGSHLSEIYGEHSVDWELERQREEQLDQAMRDVKKAILRAYNLTKVNNIFTVGEVVALSGVPLVALWSLNQIRNKNACIQVGIGGSSSDRISLSWSLVYSRENLTDAGVRDNLHKAGEWKKKVRRFLPDTAVKKPINLSCNGGRVVASGGAGSVLDKAVSFVF